MSTGEDREKARRDIRESAFDLGETCSACGVEGRTYPGRRVVRTRRGGFGADWDEESALATIDKAVSLEWRRGLLGPLLVATEPDGSLTAFHLHAKTEEDDT